MFFHRAAARAFLLALLAVPLTTNAAPLTLDDALRIFRTRGFDLLIADASVAGAQGDVTIAGAIASPQVSVSLGGGIAAAGVTDQAALSDTLYGKRRLRMAAARAALAATKGSRADVERTLELTVKQQVLQAELAKQSLVYANQAQTLAGDTLRIVQIRYKAGAVSQADVARASVQKLEADQASDLAQQTFDVARAGLAFLLGYRETPADLDVADDLMQGGRLESLPYTKESLLATALARRPDLQAARFQIERAQSSMALAKRLRLPDLFPSLQYSRESPPTFAFGVSLAPPLLYRYGGEVAKAEADLRSQELTAQKIEAQVGADVSSAFAAFTGARSRAERARTDLLAASGRARDLVRLQYEKGAASLFEFLDAQRTFLAAQNESLQALDDYWTAVFQLEQATAMELHR